MHSKLLASAQKRDLDIFLNSILRRILRRIYRRTYSSRHSPIDQLLKWTKKDTCLTKATRYARVFVRDQSIGANNERQNSMYMPIKMKFFYWTLN
jgi:hypothetical protein